MEFQIGCDPEIFLRRNGKAVSANGLIPGDKATPYPVPGGAIQVDGTAVEFNTDPVPINSFEVFNAKIVTVMGNLRKEVKKSGNYTFNISPVQDYDADYLSSLPDSAKELGCDPDYCAYTLEENPRPDGDRLFRTGAGHIHIGWGADIPTDNRDHHEICANFVKMLDATVGIFMTVIDREPRRRELYGKAGAYRTKPYGVEYRFPSNVWLLSKQRRKVVHTICNEAVRFMKAGYSVKQIAGRDPERVREILDTGDVVAAKAILANLGRAAYTYLHSAEFIKDFPNG